jgi:(p)ppGpp synthase/HD superfamily hydrolase
MIFTDKLKLALRFINSQKDLPNRKDGSPYIAHPYGVALLLSQVTNNENVIIAGLLHDIIEDKGTEKTITLDDIKTNFGEEVFNLVKCMTEDKSIEYEKRKRESREKLKTMTHEMLLIKSADLLHNAGTFLFKLKDSPEEALKQFGPSYEKSHADLQETIKILSEVWAENPFLEDLKYTIESLSAIAHPQTHQ